MRFESSSEVRAAIPTGNVVALESTIITHGMPYPQNLETARNNGSVPATIAILDGVIKVGLSHPELEQLAQAQIVSEKRTGSTTVAATMIFAHMAGIGIFATEEPSQAGTYRPTSLSLPGRLSWLCARMLELLETGGVSQTSLRRFSFQNQRKMRFRERCCKCIEDPQESRIE
jgi:hypothetical protein